MVLIVVALVVETGGPVGPSPIFVAECSNILVEQSATLMKQSTTLTEQSPLHINEVIRKSIIKYI